MSVYIYTQIYSCRYICLNLESRSYRQVTLSVKSQKINASAHQDPSLSPLLCLCLCLPRGAAPFHPPDVSVHSQTWCSTEKVMLEHKLETHANITQEEQQVQSMQIHSCCILSSAIPSFLSAHFASAVSAIAVYQLFPMQLAPCKIP